MREIDPAPPDLLDRIRRLAQFAHLDSRLPDESTPIGRATADFFHHSWANARDGLLRRTRIIRVRPEPSRTPRIFDFEIDRPFLRRPSADAEVELSSGPARGTIVYRSDLLELPTGTPAIAVFLDPEQHVFHSNYSRSFNLLCLGDLPPQFPLEPLLKHLYGILSYENQSLEDPADPVAARYFAEYPQAVAVLLPVQPLY